MEEADLVVIGAGEYIRVSVVYYAIEHQSPSGTPAVLVLAGVGDQWS